MMKSRFENLTFSWKHTEDYFPFMTETSFLKIFSVTFSCLGILLGPAALFSIIWFERFGSDKKRTLLNLLFSISCWECAIFVFLVQIPETMRFIYGPLPDFVCNSQTLIRYSMILSLLLLLDAIIITRYFFIFKLKVQ